MAGLSPTWIATLVLASVTLSLPCLLYGAWYILDAENVTWGVLVRHLEIIGLGLALTTVPLVGWMLPRLFGQLTGFAMLHAVVGLQAYAMLTFGFTGIVRVFRAKYEHDLYHDYDADVLLSEIGSEQLDYWRRRIRIGVFGYLFFWLLAYLLGVARYLVKYWLHG
ncbi:MAG: hypothetical protein ABEJ31_07245 [Haloarculaceae archaeon]